MTVQMAAELGLREQALGFGAVAAAAAAAAAAEQFACAAWAGHRSG